MLERIAPRAVCGTERGAESSSAHAFGAGGNQGRGYPGVMRSSSIRACHMAAALAAACVLSAPSLAFNAALQGPDEAPRSNDEPLLTDAIYAGGVDLAFVGRALVVATASGLDVVRDPAAEALVFEPLMEAALASPPLVAARDGAVGALTADGRLVVWDAESGAELWSAPAAVGLLRRVLAGV